MQDNGVNQIRDVGWSSTKIHPLIKRNATRPSKRQGSGIMKNDLFQRNIIASIIARRSQGFQEYLHIRIRVWQ